MFNIDTMIEYAQDFCEAGFHVMPLRGVDEKGNCKCGFDGCTNQYKHPRISNWSKAPSPTIDELDMLIVQKLFEESYGIVLSAEDIVVDFDPRNNESALDELNKLVGIDLEEESNLVITTGSGGKHLFFKKDPEKKIIKNLSSLKGIDFLSVGAFVVGCGSNHKSGFQYEMNNHKKSNVKDIGDAPDQLIDLIERQEIVRESAYEAGSSSEEELREALAWIPNDENTDYDTWLNIGMALSFETSNSMNGYALWDEWSDKSQKHDGTMMSKKWDSFANISNTSSPRTAGTIFGLAYQNGWEQSYANEIDLSKFAEKGNVEKIVIKKEDTNEQMTLNDVPDELKKINGVFGSVVDYILSTAKYPLYMPSINAALSLCSLVVGRDFTTEYENYSQLYLMSVAETGAGKEHPYKSIVKILNASGQKDLIKGEVTGKSAIVTELYSNPRSLFVKDEMAHWMQIIGSKAPSELKMSEVKAWMELYSKQDSIYSSDSFTNIKEILKESEDVKKENSITIQRPSVGLLGMTTPQKLGEAMTKMMIQDGFLNRFIVMFAQEGDQKMNRNSKPKPVPQEILSWIETIERRAIHHNRGKNSFGRNNFEKPFEPLIIPFSDESLLVLDDYEDRILKRKKQLRKNGLELMIARNMEKAMKIALTVELANDPYAMSISSESMSFAISLVDFTFEQLIKYIEFEVVENTIDKRYRDAYNTIERFGVAGVQKKDLNKMHPFKSCDSRARQEIFNYLLNESQEIVQVELKNNGRGRNPLYLYASKFVEEKPE